MFLLYHQQQFLSLQMHPLSARPFSLIGKLGTPISRSGLLGSDVEIRKSGTGFHLRRAVERDSEFEIDPDKAREALRKFDEQLESLSRKPINPPKIRASGLDPARVKMREDAPEISGSFLANSAFFLLIFTIFYNVLFITVIKPSIDGPESVEAPVDRKSPGDVLSPQLPSLPEVSTL